MSIQSLNPSLQGLGQDGKGDKLQAADKKKKKKDKQLLSQKKQHHHRKGSKSSRSSEASSGSASVSDGADHGGDLVVDIQSSAGSINDHDAEAGAKDDHKKKDSSSSSSHQDRIPTIPEEPALPKGGKLVTVPAVQPNILFRFDDVSDELLLHGTAAPLSKEEQRKVLKAMAEVQQKLATREQMNITIVTIELTQLVAAHRFTKNSPWIKASYGDSCSWVADYEEEEESEDGGKTAWTNLRWSFDLERNESDRKDLVFTVCSKSLIVGRYVIDRTEFARIPETKSGYFEVLGDVRSSVGVSGRIRLLCLRGVAERPKGPHRDQQRHQTHRPTMDTASTSSSVASSPTREDYIPLQRGPQQLQFGRRSLIVKVLSVAAMDLKPVHFLESNSPFASVEVGDWVGVSGVVNNAGMAARWNGLNWKFVLSEEVRCEVVIHSKAIKIGRLSVSVEELLAAQTTASGTVQIIKHIVNGTQITGKVKVTMMISDIKTESSSSSSSSNNNKSPQQQQDDDVETKATMIDEKGLDRSDLVSTAILGEKGDMVLLKPFIKAPFLLRISEITVLDSAQASILRKNSLTVNVVCGTSGMATDEIPNCGAFAHWINLGWKITVIGGSTFRVTAWSGGKAIGAAALSVNDLLSTPTDFENNAEIFTKLLNGRKEIVGKVRLSCKYEQSLSIDPDPTSRPGSPLHASKPGEEAADLAVAAGGDAAVFQADKSSEHNNILLDVEELSLPVSAHITGISVFDMVSAHLLLKNSPQVKIAIDRKSVMTEERVGSGPMAVWTDLNWLMKIREDSYVVIALFSRGKEIGKIEVPPTELISIPVTSKGITEYKALIKSGSQATAAKIQIRMKLSNIDTAAPVDAARQQKQHEEESSVKYVSPSSRAEYVRSHQTTLAAAASSSMRSRDGVEYGQRVHMDDDDDDDDLEEGYRDPFPMRSPTGYRDSYASRIEDRSAAAATPSYTNESSASQMAAAASQSAIVIFDSAELFAEADKQKGLLDFHMSLQEIDLLALKSMHTFSANAPTVSVACGKYIFTTQVETWRTHACMHGCFIYMGI